MSLARPSSRPHDPPPAPPGAGGVAFALAAFLIWGLFPLYWKQLAGIDALELIAHRHLWSLVFVGGLLAVRGGLREPASALRSPGTLAHSALAGILLTVNWLVFVWGVNAGHVIECSLGYFLVPLVNVLLGRLCFGERLRPAQGAAVGLAAAGVTLLVWQAGRLPWIGLSLALSFGFYGLLKKRSPLTAIGGLALETALLAPLALAYLAWRAWAGGGVLGHAGWPTTLLVLSTGAVTAVPLMLFAAGARRLRLTTLGLLQYITPTGHFLIGWLLYSEPFGPERAVAFVLIWSGLVLYTFDSVRRPASAAGAER